MSANPSPARPRTAVRPASAALVALAAVGVAALVTLTLLVQNRTGWLHDLDTGTADSLNRYIVDHRWQLDFWQAVTNGGQPTVFRLAALVGAVLLWRRGWRSAAVLTVVAVEGTSLLSTLGKVATDRARPHVPHPVSAVPKGLSAGSYPSGHALTAFVAAGVAVVLVWPVVSRGGRLAVVLLGLVVAGLVSFSRLILGVHFVTDVVAAWLLGALWLAAVATALRWRPASNFAGPRRPHRVPQVSTRRDRRAHDAPRFRAGPA